MGVMTRPPGAGTIEFAAVSDGGPTRGGAIGLVALSTDHVCELDMRQIVPQGEIPVYVSRIAISTELTVETLGAMRQDMERAAGLLLPGGRIDVIAYGCTSGTMVIGEDEVFAKLRAHRPDVPCTTPPTAARAALGRLGLKRIAVLTPYPEDINHRVRAYFAEHGFEIAAFGGFHCGTDAQIAAIAPASIIEAAIALDAPDIDGIFLSCTGMRGLQAVVPLEQRLGKPVVSSNQALAWHSLRLAGRTERIGGFGRLLTV